MQKILITGGTGMIGQSLTRLLIEKGYGVHIFTRSVANKKNSSTIGYYEWNTDNQHYDVAALNGVVAIINLAGEGIAEKRWTTSRKKAILNSRINAGKLITKLLTTETHTVHTLVQGSATGWYASPSIGTLASFQEEEQAATDYLGQTCKAWEESIAPVAELGVRVVIIRTGIVLNKAGGMVKELILPLRLGVLPVFGNGKQIVPWIHQTDLSNIFIYALENKALNGAYNATATSGTPQKALAKQIAKALGKKWLIAPPIPSFFLKLLLGEMSIELLKSSTVYNDKIKKAGFTFQYPALESIDKL